MIDGVKGVGEADGDLKFDFRCFLPAAVSPFSRWPNFLQLLPSPVFESCT